MVVDPFGGSGTTAVEGRRLGRDVMSSDRSPIAAMITRAKVAFVEGALDHRTRGRLLADLTFQHRCRSDGFGREGEGSSPDLASWFSPDTLAQLRYLWNVAETAEASAVRHVLTAIFSDVLFDCAASGAALTPTGMRRRHHWGWVADNVHPRLLVPHDAIALFKKRLASLECPPPPLPNEGRRPATHVAQQDARAMALPDEACDLVVTSPPYVGVIDYTHANRLFYMWMGWPMLADRRDEIGARYRRFRKNTVAEYKCEMRQARDEMRRVLRPGGFCAIVLGESKRFPGTAEEVLADFADAMPMAWGPMPRTPTRRRVSERGAREPVEFVCVFQKQ